MWISYGKSRVASLKTNTVPRMEQTAAVVSVKLHKLIVEQLDLPIHKAVFWTDSTIVLQYIRNEARRFQTFVAKRLSVIQGASSPCQWRHVDSLRNTAYYDPRGFSTAETVKLRCWLNGPSFLDQDESEWPRLRDEMPELPEEDRELKGKNVQVYLTVEEDNLQSLLSRYSSFYKLLTSVAWLLRFKNHLRRQSGEVRNYIPYYPSQRNKLVFVGYVSPLRKLNPVIYDVSFASADVWKGLP